MWWPMQTSLSELQLLQMEATPGRGGIHTLHKAQGKIHPAPCTGNQLP